MAAVFRDGTLNLKPVFLEIQDNVPINDEMYEAMEKYEVVKFSNEYSHPLNRLPTNIKVLDLIDCKIKDEKMIENLPCSLEKLLLPNYFHKSWFEKLPYGIKIIYFSCFIGIRSEISYVSLLPSSVKLLVFGYQGYVIDVEKEKLKILNKNYDDNSHIEFIKSFYAADLYENPCILDKYL